MRIICDINVRFGCIGIIFLSVNEKRWFLVLVVVFKRWVICQISVIDGDTVSVCIQNNRCGDVTDVQSIYQTLLGVIAIRQNSLVCTKFIKVL